MSFLRDVRVGREAAGTSEFVSRVARGIAARFYWRERYIVIEQRIAEIIDVPARDGVRIALMAPEDRSAVEDILTSALRRSSPTWTATAISICSCARRARRYESIATRMASFCHWIQR